MLNLRGGVGVRPNLRYSLKRARLVDKYTLNDDQLTHPNQIPDYIFNKLMIVDYHVREFELSNEDSDESENSGVHPMDAFLGIFHSSDIFLRRYLVTRLSECQLSVPFLLPDATTAPSKNVTMLLSALQNITKSWKSCSSNNENVKQVFATEHPFPMVSFIRVGKPILSKSSLINKIMSDGDKCHDFFSHLDMNGGDVERKLVDGLVELCWYLPGGGTRPILTQEICFANLRGDARSFDKQLNILLKISSVLCTVVSSEYRDPTVQDILKRSTRNDTKVILLFEKKLQEEEKKYFDGLQSNSGGKLSLIEKSSNEHNFVKTIKTQIKKILNEVNGRPLVELSSYVDEFGIRLDDDQKDSEFKAMIDSLLEKGIARMKKLMTLQVHIPKLADLERQMYRPLGHHSKKSIKERDEIFKRIAENENAQKKSLEHLDKEILNCLNGIANMDGLERYKAMNMLKHQLDKKQRSKSSLGLEHIIRELAQLYQIKMKQNDSAGDAEENECDYTGVAVDILLSGQPLELVDGDSFYIPLRWFNAVYTKLKEKTNDAKIFVVSVVGIQSSGKSTLLNTMFGLELPVSVARCTNGVFVSLIPVSDSLKSTSGFDYVLVVDTEGLRGSSDSQLERDNELVVFAIGLADVTIVNIMGENTGQMKDFLDIAVHSFLKMRLVKERKNCKIVQHGVTAPDANEKLAGDRSKFIKSLDEMTKIAATQENCSDKFNKFNDIISFNEKKDVFYLPKLHHRNPPMASVNPQYGRDVEAIKNSIIDVMCSKKSSNYSVSNFQTRVTGLWKALLHEHFVFSLRNTIEVRARTSLDEKYSKISVSMMVTGIAELEADVDFALRNCSTPDERKKEWDMGRRAISRKAEELETKMEKAMDAFFKNSKDKATLDKWRREISDKIREEKANQVKKAYDNCSNTLLYLQRIQDIKEKRITYKEKVMEEAKAFIASFHDTEDEKNVKKIFEEEWKRWIADVPESKNKRFNISEEMVNVLAEKNVAASKDELEEQNNTLNFQNPNVVHKDVTYRISFFRRLFQESKIQKQCVDCAKTTAKNAVNKALEFAKSESESGLEFTPSTLRKMRDNVLTTIDVETKKYSKYSLEFNRSLRNAILLHTFSHSYKYFDEMQERFIQEQDIRGHLEKKLRPTLEKYFDNVGDREKQLLLAASLFVEVLEKQIESALNRNMGVLLKKEILKNSEFQDKEKFHAKVLIKLGEEGNFDSYILYLEDPNEFLKMKLKERIEYHFLHEIKDETLSLLKNEINKINGDVKLALDFADKKTDEEDQTLSSWIQKFIKMCSTLVVKKEMFATGAIEDLDKIGVFQGKVRANLVECVNSFIKRGVNLATFRKWNSSPYKFIVDRMFVNACQSICPFCKALCDKINDHETHSTQSHRLVGIVGLKKERTEKLMTSFCTERFAEGKKFKSSVIGSDSWEIPGSTVLKQSIYWKWFMTTFWKELAEEHCATPATPNLYWKFIKFNQAKEQLMCEYNL